VRWLWLFRFKYIVVVAVLLLLLVVGGGGVGVTYHLTVMQCLMLPLSLEIFADRQSRFEFNLSWLLLLATNA
jgi:hypothetical protein